MGELWDYVSAGRRREQQRARMLYTHAGLCSAAFAGKMPPVWEAFPLWTEEEIDAFRTEKLRQSLMKHAKGGT